MGVSFKFKRRNIRKVSYLVSYLVRNKIIKELSSIIGNNKNSSFLGENLSKSTYKVPY